MKKIDVVLFFCLVFIFAFSVIKLDVFYIAAVKDVDYLLHPPRLVWQIFFPVWFIVLPITLTIWGVRLFKKHK